MSFAVNWNTLIAGADAAGQAVFKNLQTFASKLNVWISREHDPITGVHTDVTANSATVAGLLTTQRFRFNPLFAVTIDPGADGVLIVDKPYNVINVVGPGWRLDGLFNSLYDLGDVVLLFNATDDNGATGTDFTLRLQASAPNAVFRGNPGLPNEDHTLKPGRGVILLRQRNSNGNATSNMYWRSVGVP